MSLVNWICGELAVDKCELLSKRRDAALMEKRRIVVCFLRDLGWSYPQIGRELNRNHASILHLHKTSDDREQKVAEILRTVWEVKGHAN